MSKWTTREGCYAEFIILTEQDNESLKKHGNSCFLLGILLHKIAKGKNYLQNYKQSIQTSM